MKKPQTTPPQLSEIGAACETTNQGREKHKGGMQTLLFSEIQCFGTSEERKTTQCNSRSTKKCFLLNLH
jgi:hypothetical protein